MQGNLGSDNMTQHRDEEADCVRLGRHKAQCSICNHPNCSDIEEHWLDWVYASKIEYAYDVSRDALYRHAHALGLFSKRRGNYIRALERLIEKVDVVSPTASGVVLAVQTCMKLNSAAQAAKQVQGPDPKKLFGRMSQLERESFARDGSLPEWFSGEIGATPSDGQGGEKDSQVTEPKRLQ